MKSSFLALLLIAPLDNKRNIPSPYKLMDFSYSHHDSYNPPLCQPTSSSSPSPSTQPTFSFKDEVFNGSSILDNKKLMENNPQVPRV